MSAKEIIEQGKAILGIEFGSTRIKAVLTDSDSNVIAMGAHDWENKLENGIWTYSMDDIHAGLRDCYSDLAKDVKTKYGTEIKNLAALGISAMMHGYLAFDKDENLLVPFRTWRNTITGEAAAELTKEFDFNIPQRWSIAHLYNAIIKKESHVPNIDHITTLAGYVHFRLTGESVLGVGEASGMFPIDSSKCDYDEAMAERFDKLSSSHGFGRKLRDVLPKVLPAGECAGKLTAEGAAFLDPSGILQAGTPVAPPEGDAGTGMVATNAVAAKTGNVSAGTSIFSMIVLEKPLKRLHEELDMVTTPDGYPVAMVHCNNCTSDINAWVGIITEALELFGSKTDKGEIFTKLFEKAATGDADCGGVVTVPYLSGEPVTGFEEGRPLAVRQPDAAFNLANFMRSNLYSALASLKIGMDILTKEENVPIDRLMGHGGYFKTPVVGQSFLAAAMNAPVTVMENAGEGGPWGMAILASYMINKAEGETLPVFLDSRIFAGTKSSTISPDANLVKGFDKYTENFRSALAAEKEAVCWKN